MPLSAAGLQRGGGTSSAGGNPDPGTSHGAPASQPTTTTTTAENPNAKSASAKRSTITRPGAAPARAPVAAPVISDAAPTDATPASSSSAPTNRDSGDQGPAAARASSSSTTTAAAAAAADPVTPPSGTSSSSSTSRASALLSRLGLPSFTIRSRNRNVIDFHIRPDEPHKIYSAGDTVRGHVNVAILKPIRITHLVVALHGYVHVFKDSSAKAKASATAVQPVRGGISELPQYHGGGLASLFQDEQVLAGDGRLDAGRYEFRFELIFPAVGLPSSIDFERGTVSYIVTATLTRPTAIAPTMSCEKRVVLVEKIDIGHLPPPRSRTIFLEPISRRARRKRSALVDKAHAPPVPQEPAVATTALHATSINSANTANSNATNSNATNSNATNSNATNTNTANTNATNTNATNTNDHTSEAGSVDRSVSIAASESVRHSNPPERSRGPIQIDLRSEVSGGSGRSISTAVSRRSDATPLSHVSAYQSPAKQKVVNDKTITATIELLKGGCLAGDVVTVRVSVQHIKRLKSLTGVIVTLFRQSKIDSAPPASLFSGNDFEDSRHAGDDGYPRSRTGLAGLSLSSSSSTSIFRKDLDQNTAPLIIDPLSLHASVTVSLKLPDDAFPTIRGVPGAMVSFRYHVEVIVDLGGKLSSQVLQGGQPSNPRFGQYASGASDNAHGPRIATNIIDTAPLRRQKGVVSISMETVVGTVDSSRRRRKSSLRLPPPPRQQSQQSQQQQQTFRVPESDEDEVIRADLNDNMSVAASTTAQPALMHPSRANSGQRPRPLSVPSQTRGHDNALVDAHDLNNQYPTHEAAPAYIPQPQVPDTHSMSEKERIRQAETRLLPSQPPAASGAGASSSSAPPPPDDEDIYDAQDGNNGSRHDNRNHHHNHHQHNDGDEAGPSAPSEDVLNAAEAMQTQFPAEDKQEMERRRLIEEASAPPEFPDDMCRPEERGQVDVQPSAPVLDEEEEELAGLSSRLARRDGRGGEQLPAYER